jgi:glycosyltransferase involved in cell wall biosynthesis
LVDALRVAGHEVEVVTAFPHHLSGRVFNGYGGKFYAKDSYKDVVVHRTWIYAAGGTGLRRLLSYLSFSVSSLLGLARSIKPDVLFIESPPLFLAISGWFYAAVRKVPIVLNVADLWPDVIEEFGVVRQPFVLGAARRLESWAYSKATIINGITDGVYNRLLEKGVPRRKLLMLPNGVDVDLFTPHEPDVDLRRAVDPGGRSIILYAGTHGIAHGMEVIVEAAKKLGEEPVLFLLIGAGSAKERLEKLARTEKLDNIKFLDPVPLAELPKFYSVATASLATLRPGEMSRKVRPAKMFTSMASGVPVIFSGAGEGADLLRRADAGFVTKPGDAEDLARAVRTLCGDASLRSRFSANGRRFVEHEFRWDRITARWLSSVTERLAPSVGSGRTLRRGEGQFQ